MKILQQWKERRRLKRMQGLLARLISGERKERERAAKELDYLARPEDIWLLPRLLSAKDSCWHCESVMQRLGDEAFTACTEAVQKTEEPAHGNALSFLRLWGERSVPFLARDLARGKSYFGVQSMQDIEEKLATQMACSRMGVDRLRYSSDVEFKEKNEAVKRVMVLVVHALEGDPVAVEGVFGIMFSENPCFGIQWYPWLLDDAFLASTPAQMRVDLAKMKGRLTAIYEACERSNEEGLEAMGRGLTLGAD